MRSSRALLLLALAAFLSALLAVPALAQDDEDDEEYEEYDEYAYEEPEEMELQGFAAVNIAQTYQDTELAGGTFDNTFATELSAGFQAGDYLVFTGGWEWQRDDAFTTHFFPLSARFLSPSIAERARFFGEASWGILFSRLRDEFDNIVDENERGSAVRVRAGAELDIAGGFSAVVQGGYAWGLGSTDDYEYGTVGVGLQYRWGL